MEKKIKIKKISSISIKQYKEIYKLTIDKSLENDIKIISILTDIDIEVLNTYNYSVIQDLIKIIDGILAEDEKLVDFKYKGKKYIFDDKTNKYTTGQFIDLYHFTNKDVIENLDYICAILYRQKGEVYDSNKVEERRSIFNDHMSIGYAQSAALFFFHLKIRLLEDTKASLEKSWKKSLKLMKKNQILK